MTGTLAEKPDWRPVRHFEANALLTGGPDCPDNLPLRDLVARELPIHADVLGATLALAPEQRVKLSGPAPLTLELQSLSA